MCEIVKEIIFGLNKFSKLPFEARFELAKRYLDEHLNEIKNNEKNKNNSIEINIKDIESIIFKINELLRIRSSNLNKAINNPKRELKKRDVLNFLDYLNLFLENYKKNVSKNTEKYFYTKNKDVEHNYYNKNKPNNIVKGENENAKNKELEGKKIVINDIEINLKNNLLYIGTNELLKIKNIIKYLFNESINYNILINKNNALIIPRFESDKFLFLYKNINYSINEIYQKIIAYEKSNEVKERNRIKLFKEEENDFKKEIKKEEIIIEKKDNQEGNNKIIDPNYLDLSNKERVDVKSNVLKDQELSKKVENVKREFVPTVEEKVELEKVELPKVEKKKDILDKLDYKVYEDDLIKINVLEKEPVGMIEIVLKENKLENFSYGLIYSKYLITLMFQIIKCDGTNVIYKKNKFILLPRFENDNLININSQQASPDHLVKIFNKINNSINKNNNDSNNKNNKYNKNNNFGDKDISKNNKSNNDKENESNIDERKKKVKLILERLQRIP